MIRTKFPPLGLALLLLAPFFAACEATPSDESNADAILRSADVGPEPAYADAADLPTVAQVSNKRNVLLIILDDVGRDDIGVYQPAGTVSRTPNIDALAADGVYFSRTWTNPVCSPTRASVMTGRHAFRHGVGEQIIEGTGDAELGASETTIAELLRNAGYATGLFGKWHLGTSVDAGCQPATHGGFDYFAGGLGGGTASYTSWTEARATGADTCTSPTTAAESGYITTENASDAVDWIGDQVAANKKFFAVVAFNAAHTPWHIPPASLHSDRTLDTKTAAYCNTAAGDQKCYLAMLDAADTTIGTMLDDVSAIDSGATLDDTLIIVLGDNGDDGRVAPAGVDSTRSKSTVYQAGVTVPMIISGPGITSPGREEDALVNSLDLYATIADAADIDLSSALPAGTTIDSVSLQPYLDSSSAADQKSEILVEVFEDGDPTLGDVAIRNDQYKLIVFQDGTQSLFDLDADATELVDLNDGTLTRTQRRALSSLQTALAAYGR